MFINGKNGVVLNLYRGYKYRFEIESCHGHSFFVTTSPCGGLEAVSAGRVAPVSSGHFELDVDDRTPRFLYYQDGKHCCLGGLIVVHSS